MAAGPEAARATEKVVLGHLALRDFRNVERLDLAIPAAGMALIGDNGHGKTNFLEAIYYLQLLRSMRGARDIDLVRFGAPGFHIGARAQGSAGHELGVGFERATRRKKVMVDGAEAERMSDALGALSSVIFSPRDVELVAGAPTARRRYLDVVLALTSRRYLVALQQYRGALARRNAALRDATRNAASGFAHVEVWEPALAEHGAVLWTERARWVAGAATRFSELCGAIGERAPVRIRYAAAAAREPGEIELADAQDALRRGLESHRAQDVRRGLTHTGPHRDELELALGGRALRLFGSAGQQRTAAIAMRFLESATLRERTGRVPIVLLDDPFAELDPRRSRRILELLATAGLGQAILAVPRVADIPREMTSLDHFTIEDGAIRAGREA